MNILIVGSDLNSILLGQYLKQQKPMNDIYITSEKLSEETGCIAINIKEIDITAISDFIKYNQIEFTIVMSQSSIINGLPDELKKEGFPVFAPLSESARITFLTSVAKKIMYKLKINTPKFGIFDRENIAIEYLRNVKMPIIIQKDFKVTTQNNEVYSTFSKAKEGVQKIFDNNNEKIIIENYIDAQPIYLYFITDGYDALPLISIERMEEDNYCKICAPSRIISHSVILHMLNKVIYPLLDDIKSFAGYYTGILGFKAKFIRNGYYILEFYNEFQNYDFQTFLSLYEGDLLDIMIKTSKGELNNCNIMLNDLYSFTLAIDKKDITIDETFDYGDYIFSEDLKNYIITSCASTLNKAKSQLYNNIENFAPALVDYLKKDDLKREIRI